MKTIKTKQIPVGKNAWIVSNGTARLNSRMSQSIINATTLQDGVYNDADVYMGMGLAGPALFKIPIL